MLWRRVFEEFRLAATRSSILLAEGEVERGSSARTEPDIIHVVVNQLERLDVPGRDVQKLSRDFH